MSSTSDKKLCIASRAVSNFYNLDGCSQFQCPKGTVLCGLSFDFEHPEFQEFEYGTLAVKDRDEDTETKGTEWKAETKGAGLEDDGNKEETEETEKPEEVAINPKVTENQQVRENPKANVNTQVAGNPPTNPTNPTKVTSSSSSNPTSDITFGPVEWSDMIEDAEVGYDLPEGRFIVGMKMYLHSGKISFKVATSEVRVDSKPVYFSERMVSAPIIVEDVQNWFVANEDCVLTGIHIYSSKDIQTGYFCYGALSLVKPKQTQEYPFDLVVALHPDEKYYPLNPADYIHVSRLRKHHSSSQGPDPCYDTHSKQFVPEEMHLPSFYCIDPKVVNSFHSYEPERRLFNLRPHDIMSLKGSEVYLQPMVKLRGDYYPNGRIPVFTRILSYNLIGIRDVTYYDFWMFFGYNHEVCKGISFSHQGDWEHVMVKTSNGTIIAAWLSQHGRFQYFPKEELEIVDQVVEDNDNGNGKKRQLLKIYSAEGSHTLYPNEGSHPIKGGLNREHTDVGGYQWKITDCTVDLETQPWRDFAGAWGEVGEFSHTTGPLGPWYRRFDFWHEDKIALKDITKEGDVIIVADNTLLTTPFEESRDNLHEAPKDTVLVGMKHCGDENGFTRCVYSTLKAIDHEGNPVEGQIELKDVHWDQWFQESNSLYNAPDGFVILDRQHIGDENGQTRFKIGRITFNGLPTAITPADAFITNQIYIESQGVFFRTSPYFLMVGSQHNGDENGDTVNFQGLVTVSKD